MGQHEHQNQGYNQEIGNLKILCDNLFKYAGYFLLRLHQVSIHLVQSAQNRNL